jgi:hypothetical protein
MKIKCVFLVIISISLLACGQQSNEDFLIGGKWVVYRTLNQKGDSISFMGEVYDNRDDTLEFFPKGKLNVYWIDIPGEPPDKSTYVFINDSLLQLGNRKYFFKKIDKDKMILEEYDPDLPQVKSLFLREYWRRIED